MGSFEDIVKLYKEKSQQFVEQHEELFATILTHFYITLGDEELTATFGFDPEFVRHYCVPGLIREGMHPPINAFYKKYSDDLEQLVISPWGRYSTEDSATIFSMFAAKCGFRPDIEKSDLEYETSFNSDLPDEKLVVHLLKERGVFGARAYTVPASNPKTDYCKDRGKIYCVMMALLEKTARSFFQSQEPATHPNAKPPESQPDIDAETDF